MFIFVVSLSALLLSNSIKEKRGKTRKQEESSETLHSQIKEFLDLNCNYCSRLLTSTALVQKNNVFRILPVRHLFSSLAVQHLHLQSARTLLIFNETARKEGFWYISDAFVFTSMLFVYYFCMNVFVNWKIQKFSNSVGDFYETSKQIIYHLIISFSFHFISWTMCCCCCLLFFSFLRPSKFEAKPGRQKKLPFSAQRVKPPPPQAFQKSSQRKILCQIGKVGLFFGKVGKFPYLMISTYMDYILDAYCMD